MGYVDGRTFHPLYDRWGAMIKRCTSPSDPSWVNYGGRGIRVCARWRRSFWAYVNDLGPMPEPGMSIDRIDNDGDYTPGNVRWATRQQQNENKRQYRRAMTCRRGHPVNEQNTYVRKDGKHSCRPCLAARARRIRAAKKRETST